jgi:sulfur carrier protein
MKIMINGEAVSFEGALSLAEVIESQGFGGMLVAVARNGAFVAKGAYGETVLEDGDAVEVVSPMQGG